MAVCGHCGYDAADLATCPLCSTPVHATAPAQEAQPVAALPAWEDDQVGFPTNLIRTWQSSVLAPSAFFAGVPYERAAGKPILFYLILSVLGSFLWLWWSALFSVWEVPLFSAWTEFFNSGGAEGVGQPAPAASALLNFFMAPFIAIFSLIVWSLLLHLFVLMLGRNRRNLTATVRAIGYTAGPALFAIVPVVGGLVGGVWTVVLTVIGIREAHRMTTGLAITTVLLAVVVPMLFFVFAILALVLAFAPAFPV